MGSTPVWGRADLRLKRRPIHGTARGPWAPRMRGGCMTLTLRWVGDDDELDRVAEARLLCYGAATKDLDHFRGSLRADPRLRPGDCLLAERGGRAVGTSTSLSLRMWVRGGVIPCQ